MPSPAPAAPFVDRFATPAVRVRVWSYQGPIVSGRSAHAGTEVSFIESGRATYRIGGDTFAAKQGNVVVVPAGVEHATTLEGDLQGTALWLDRALVDEIADAMRSPGALSVTSVTRPSVAPLAAALREEAVVGDHGDALAMEALVDAIAVRLVRALRGGGGGNDRDRGDGTPARACVRDRRIRAAVERIHADYAQALGVDVLARTAGMSRFHFTRLFREEVGVAPYKYLLRVRVARAAELLRGGRRSVTEAAFEVGFQDVARFSRTFRQATGRSPSELLHRGGARFDARMARNA
jgi:AraC family transcriptional regulator